MTLKQCNLFGTEIFTSFCNCLWLEEKVNFLSIFQAAVEQFTWAPYSYCQFYLGMSLLEGKSLKDCINEVKQKFWQTWKVGKASVDITILAARNFVLFIIYIISVNKKQGLVELLSF